MIFMDHDVARVPSLAFALYKSSISLTTSKEVIEEHALQEEAGFSFDFR